jgi:hypothetical protein
MKVKRLLHGFLNENLDVKISYMLSLSLARPIEKEDNKILKKIKSYN